MQLTLTGQSVELRPLQQHHAQALLDAAADGQLWNMKLTVVPGPATVDAYIETALAGREAGTVMPFVIVRRETGAVVGSTRFWKIDRANRKLEIDIMQCVRVQFTTDELNEKSRAAILRIGAKQEGIVRHERIMPDGRKRNSVRFSIIDTEWPEVKAMLEAKLGR
jgi:RimJ/RimL family protein N-acetyltransferase